ncbi:hypothetical protein [Evansella vedderi]|nr:hypothetical protein [Evansella vedderi]
MKPVKSVEVCLPVPWEFYETRKARRGMLTCFMRGDMKQEKQEEVCLPVP